MAGTLYPQETLVNVLGPAVRQIHGRDAYGQLTCRHSGEEKVNKAALFQT
jgi:hypothetical protein